MVFPTTGQLLLVALNTFKYSLVLHGALPVNEDDEVDPDNEFTSIGHIIPGSPRQDWSLQVGIDYKESQDDRMTLLFGLLTNRYIVFGDAQILSFPSQPCCHVSRTDFRMQRGWLFYNRHDGLQIYSPAQQEGYTQRVSVSSANSLMDPPT